MAGKNKDYYQVVAKYVGWNIIIVNTIIKTTSKKKNWCRAAAKWIEFFLYYM